MRHLLFFILLFITNFIISIQASPHFSHSKMIVTGFNQGDFEIGLSDSTDTNKITSKETFINSSIGIRTGWFIHPGLAIGPQVKTIIISKNEDLGFKLDSLTLTVGAFTVYYFYNSTGTIPFLNLDANFVQNFTSSSGPASDRVSVGNSGFSSSVNGGIAYFIVETVAIEISLGANIYFGNGSGFFLREYESENVNMFNLTSELTAGFSIIF